MSEILENLNKQCKYLLNQNIDIESISYLNSRILKSSQDFFDFGCFPKIENINLLLGLISKDDLKKENLLFTKQIEDSLFPRNIEFSYFESYPIVMPFKDQYGRVKGLVGRTLLSDSERKQKNISKYKNTNTFQKSKYLFGLFENKEHILNSAGVYLVEGQFDLIKAYEHGLRNVVAVGSCHLSNTQLSLIKRYTNRIFVLFDNDSAGEKGRVKIYNKYNKFINIKNAYFDSKFKDLDEYLSKLNGKSIEIEMD